MKKLLLWYFGPDVPEHSEREAFSIGLSRLADPRPRLEWSVLADSRLLDSPDGDMGSDWRATGSDLRAALEAVATK